MQTRARLLPASAVRPSRSATASATAGVNCKSDDYMRPLLINDKNGRRTS